MKVLITAPSLDETRNVSGISTVVRQIIEHSSRQFVHFQAGRGDGSPAGILWILKQFTLPFRFFFSIRREKPDVVHINTSMTGLAICRDAALVRAASFFRSRVVVMVHGGKYSSSPFISKTLERIADRMLRAADSVVVLREAERDEFVQRWPDLKVRVLPNAVSTGDLPYVKHRNDPPVVVFLGRMHKSKGLNEIVEACQKLHHEGVEFEFKAYGDGPMRNLFVGEMERLLGSSFEFGGVVSGSDKWDKLAAADIFVLPTEFEGLSMAMLEALAAGCIVVASDIPSITSVITNGVNGFLMAPKDSEALAATLKQLLDDRDAWPPVQDAGQATIRERFAIEEYVRKLDEIYLAAVGDRN